MINSWLKRSVRLWLGIDASQPPTVADLSPDQLAVLRRSDVNAQNALDQSLDIKRKFDALNDALGIGFVVNKDGSVSMAGIVDNGLFGDAARYIDATVLAEKIMAAEWKMTQQRASMLLGLHDEFKKGRSFGSK